MKNKLLGKAEPAGAELGIYFSDDFGELGDELGLTLDDMYCLRNIKNRELWLSGEITDMTAESVLTEIREFNRKDYNDEIPFQKRVPIKLFIDSPGGDVVAGLSIIDTIKASETPVWTINFSKAYSMAFHVLINGDKRFAFKSSSFLLHDGSEGGFDSSSKFRDRLKFNDSLEQITRQNVIERTKITKREYEMNARREWYMLVPEAKELGVVDEVVERLSQVLTFGQNQKLDTIFK